MEYQVLNTEDIGKYRRDAARVKALECAALSVSGQPNALPAKFIVSHAKILEAYLLGEETE